MKTYRTLLCGAVCWLALGASAEEWLPGPWTARIELGGNIPENPSLTLLDGPVTGGDELDLSAGVQFNAALGYRLQPWLILEGEFGISGNDINAVGNWTYPDSYMSQFSMMANLVVERPEGVVRPFAGIGAGGVVSSLTFGEYYFYGYNEADGEATDFVAAAQAFGGVRFRLGENMNLGVTYRALFVDDQKWKVHWRNGADFKIGATSMLIHSINLSFSVNF
jgi:opacity protein-like surface antigen